MNPESAILCESGPCVSVHRCGNLIVLHAGTPEVAEFPCDLGDLEDVLRGVPLQLSGAQGFLRAVLEDGELVVEFAVGRQTKQFCRCPVARLERAIGLLQGESG